MSEDFKDFVFTNSFIIVTLSFVFWTGLSALITGYFKIGQTCLVQHKKNQLVKVAIASNWKFFKISDAYKLSEILGGEIYNGRYAPKRLDKKDTNKILTYFSKRKDKTKKYI